MLVNVMFSKKSEVTKYTRINQVAAKGRILKHEIVDNCVSYEFSIISKNFTLPV